MLQLQALALAPEQGDGDDDVCSCVEWLSVGRKKGGEGESLRAARRAQAARRDYRAPQARALT